MNLSRSARFQNLQVRFRVFTGILFAVVSLSLMCDTRASAQAADPSTHVATKTSASASMPGPKEIQHMQSELLDWPNLARYRADDEALPAPAAGEQRVVFLGDSITDSWGRGVGVFFPGKPYINRGISGQTTPQMLLRFQQDVVRLRPSVVVVLAGTNDIAGNTGPSTPQMIEDNFTSMAAIARQSGIKLVLASILPAIAYPWKPGVQPVAAIREVNSWLRDFCTNSGCVYLDYYSAMTDEKGAMLPGLSSDGVHPTAIGYELMAPLAERAIMQALAK
jgi:lysophospholipase L1-like esterase